MSSRIFFSKPFSRESSAEILSLFCEALEHLYPTAKPCEPPRETLKTSPSFFLKEKDTLVWVEIVLEPFSEKQIPPYLAKARAIQVSFPGKVEGLLASPDFEPGIRELTEVIRIPIRLFRYRSGRRIPSEEEVLWLEELTPSLSPKGLPSESAPAPPPFPCRLTREELREFIELELDTPSR